VTAQKEELPGEVCVGCEDPCLLSEKQVPFLNGGTPFWSYHILRMYACKMKLEESFVHKAPAFNSKFNIQQSVNNNYLLASRRFSKVYLSFCLMI
jgi:hypothetical protein